MHLRTRVLFALLAAFTLVVGLSAQPAAAGWNGQQIVLYTSGCWWGQISGFNQYGDWADTGRFYIPRYDKPVPDWWWRGQVYVDCWDYYGRYAGYVTDVVPQIQPDNDWYPIAIEPAADNRNFTAGGAVAVCPKLPNSIVFGGPPVCV